MRGRRAVAFLGAGVLVALVLVVPTGGRANGAAAPALRELVGQRLVVAFRGTVPSRALLDRARRGEIAGVILFGGNVVDRAQLRSSTDRLQAAAAAGGRPPLLVAVDQEGGDIRRLRWAGPFQPTAELGLTSPSSVRRVARQAGLSLRAAGVNVDLAPVADVPAAGSFMAQEKRTFSPSAARTGLLAAAFAVGLADAGVAAAVKHFPGIGRASRSTDRSAVTIDASEAALERDLAPFRRVLGAGAPLVMLANASYSALGPAPAAWSTRAQALLRVQLGFDGVTITDALEPAAVTRGLTTPAAAALAARAGVDLILVTGSEASSALVYRELLRQASDGTISTAGLRRSYDRVLALRQRLR